MFWFLLLELLKTLLNSSAENYSKSLIHSCDVAMTHVITHHLADLVWWVSHSFYLSPSPIPALSGRERVSCIQEDYYFIKLSSFPKSFLKNILSVSDEDNVMNPHVTNSLLICYIYFGFFLRCIIFCKLLNLQTQKNRIMNHPPGALISLNDSERMLYLLPPSPPGCMVFGQISDILLFHWLMC